MLELADGDDEFATVMPSSLVYKGPEFLEASITIHPFCVRPYDITLEPSSPELLFLPREEPVQLNGCGGETSTFEIFMLAGVSAINFVDLVQLPIA